MAYDAVAASARSKVQNAICAGRLKRQPCETCGSDWNIHGHHDDYLKPLDVRWLCASCHKIHHLELAKAKGIAGVNEGTLGKLAIAADQRRVA
jgi:ribosomal protein S27AE